MAPISVKDAVKSLVSTLKRSSPASHGKCKSVKTFGINISQLSLFWWYLPLGKSLGGLRSKQLFLKLVFQPLRKTGKSTKKKSTIQGAQRIPKCTIEIPCSNPSSGPKSFDDLYRWPQEFLKCVTKKYGQKFIMQRLREWNWDLTTCFSGIFSCVFVRPTWVNSSLLWAPLGSEQPGICCQEVLVSFCWSVEKGLCSKALVLRVEEAMPTGPQEHL